MEKPEVEPCSPSDRGQRSLAGRALVAVPARNPV